MNNKKKVCSYIDCIYEIEDSIEAIKSYFKRLNLLVEYDLIIELQNVLHHDVAIQLAKLSEDKSQ